MINTSVESAAENIYIEKCTWQNLQSAFVVRFPSRQYYLNHLTCFAFNIIQTLLTISLNYLAVHALWKSSQLRRKTTLFLIMVLSASDLAVGIIVGPVFLFHLGMEICAMQDCFGSALKKLVFDILPGISFGLFVVLNVEIYLSIIYPIFHKTKVTNKRALKTLCVVVFVSVLRSYLFTFHISKRGATMFVTVFILLIVMALVFIHVKIFMVVYRRRKIGFAGTAVGGPSSSALRRKSFLRGVREAKSCLLVLFCTVLCYLPSAIEDGMLETSTFTVIFFNPWRCTFFLAASFLNCIVFFWRNGILRKEAKDIIHSFCKIF
jgi:hypothetical protein